MSGNSNQTANRPRFKSQSVNSLFKQTTNSSNSSRSSIGGSSSNSGITGHGSKSPSPGQFGGSPFHGGSISGNLDKGIKQLSLSSSSSSPGPSGTASSARKTISIGVTKSSNSENSSGNTANNSTVGNNSTPNAWGVKTNAWAKDKESSNPSVEPVREPQKETADKSEKLTKETGTNSLPPMLSMIQESDFIQNVNSNGVTSLNPTFMTNILQPLSSNPPLDETIVSAITAPNLSANGNSSFNWGDAADNGQHQGFGKKIWNDLSTEISSTINSPSGQTANGAHTPNSFGVSYNIGRNTSASATPNGAKSATNWNLLNDSEPTHDLYNPSSGIFEKYNSSYTDISSSSPSNRPRYGRSVSVANEPKGTGFLVQQPNSGNTSSWDTSKVLNSREGSVTSASLTTSPNLWVTTPNVSMSQDQFDSLTNQQSPTMHRMSRFFPSPIVEQRANSQPQFNDSTILSGRSNSAGLLSYSSSITSPLNFGLFGNSSGGVTNNTNNTNNNSSSHSTVATPLFLGHQTRTPSFIDPLSSMSLSNSQITNYPIDQFELNTSGTQISTASLNDPKSPPYPDKSNNFNGFNGGGSVMPMMTDIFFNPKANLEPSIRNVVRNDKRRKRGVESSTRCITRTFNEDQLIEQEEYKGVLNDDDEELLSLPPKAKSATPKSLITNHDKIYKYIKTVITKQPILYSVYVSSLPYDTPVLQCQVIIKNSIKQFGELIYLSKEPQGNLKSKLSADLDLFIRFKVIVKLYNENKVPYKTHKFVNDATGRDSKMLLFFDYSTTSNTGDGDPANIQPANNSVGGKAEVSSYPEGFSSTFHRRGINNFMFVRELQSKMIINKGRNFETGEFRISLPIEELNLGHFMDELTNTANTSTSSSDDSKEFGRKVKRSYIVNIDVKELDHGSSTLSGNGNGNGNGNYFKRFNRGGYGNQRYDKK